MVIFYHELNNTSGGAAVLIINLIKGLTEKKVHVTLINFKNGVLHKELSSVDSTFLQVIDNDKGSIKEFSSRVTKDDIIVSTHFYSVFRFFKKANPRFLFYCVGHIQLFEINRLFGKLNFLGLTRKLVQLLNKKKGVVFIEQNALNKTIDLFKLGSDSFSMLPIPVSIVQENKYLKKRKVENDTLVSFTYVGRAVESKIYPVKKIIDDLIEVSNSLPQVRLYIVTDDARRFASMLPAILPDNISIKYYENLTQQMLGEFLVENSDIHFGHATSALEGAKLGLPTVLIDFAFEEFPKEYSYSFIYQTPPENIGTDANERNFSKGVSMERLIELCNDKAALETISDECYRYVNTEHNITTITNRLIEYVDQCDSRISDIRKYLIRYWLP